MSSDAAAGEDLAVAISGLVLVCADCGDAEAVLEDRAQERLDEMRAQLVQALAATDQAQGEAVRRYTAGVG